MRNFLDNVRYKFSRWMIGRYGTDELSRALTFTALALILLSYIPKLWFLSILAWIGLFYSIFRSISKNISARSRERDTFLQITDKVKRRFNTYKKMWADRKYYKYFRCPQCRSMIRVPKGKGKIAISCRKCRNEIIKTT